jgi:hypothetical protein
MLKSLSRSNNKEYVLIFFFFYSDGLHLTPEGNGLVHQEVTRVFNEAWLSAAEMPYDFPHHSEINGKNPEKAFQIQCL